MSRQGSETPEGISLVGALADDAMTEHLYLRRKEKGDDVTLEQVRRDWMERPDRAARLRQPSGDSPAKCRRARAFPIRTQWSLPIQIKSSHYPVIIP